MKNCILILFSLAVSLLSGCSENDYSSDQEGTSSKSMCIGVSLPSRTTRVIETADATKGLITTWESTDALQVFHKYTNSGTVGTMQGFEFTSTAAGSSSIFKYSGAEGYSFTPNNSLYTFNALPTASNYTQIYNSSNDNFTLSLNGYGSQDGTVTNLRNYDAMCGVSSVSTEGTPATMAMNHLTSVLRFDLSNVAFTGTLTSVKFTYAASSGSSLLPASGSFTLSNTGAVTTNTLTNATSWTVSNVVASSGIVPVYLMTFPDQRSGTLTITATTSDGNAYSREITLSGLSLTSGNMKTYKVTLNKEATYSLKYYMWDATVEYVNGVTNYNTITSGVATNSCKDCPTHDQIQMYIGAGVYWDNTTSWKDASGIAHTGGIWLKKKAYITGFDAGTATPKNTWAAPTAGIPTNIGQYFFLPALGYMFSSTPSNVGSEGCYWSCTPNSDNTKTYSLNFNSSGIYVGNFPRYTGASVLSVQ